MDVISFAEASTANSRIEKVNANPDSNSGIVTVPSVIAAGDSVTIPAGRTAVLPNVQVDGELVVDGEVFVPSGTTFGDLDTTKEDKDIINTDNVPNIYMGGKRKEWTKGIPAHTGMIAIELSGLYGQSAMNGMMNVNLLEVGSTKIARALVISGQWNNGTSMWDYGFANDLTGADTLTIRFARDVANSKVYILLGETATVWANTRVSIEVPMSSYNSGLNLGFVIGTMSNLTGITVDYTKNIGTKVDKITSTTNKLVKFSNTSSGIADSVIYDNGVNVLVGTTTDNGVDKLQVNGSISSSTAIFVADLNNLKDTNGVFLTGDFTWNVAYNAPCSYGTVHQISRGSSECTQMAMDMTSSNMYTRRYINGWTVWRTI